MKKCSACGSVLKQGGCFQEIYEWCPRCEEQDTEPDFQLVTPTEPMVWGCYDRAWYEDPIK
jgi:hypothetical protein